MEIKYLTMLSDTPARPSLRSDVYIPVIKPISWGEIVELESLYNRGNPFPAALRELLFLAGNDCYVFDFGIFDSQEEMQEYVRRNLEDRLPKMRPFMAIHVYGSDYFYFVYLDEGEDPPVYEMGYTDSIRNMAPTLSQLINRRIEYEKAKVTTEEIAFADNLFNAGDYISAFKSFKAISGNENSSPEGRSDAFLMMGVITLIDGSVENLPDESGLHYFLKSLEYNPQNVGALFNIVEGLGPSINQHRNIVAFDNALKTLTDMGHNYTVEERVMLVRQTAFRNSV